MAGAAELGGAALAAAGLGWMAWAAWWWARSGNPLAWWRAPRRLVDDGPFALSRHPLWLGAAVAGAGLALLAGSAVLLGLVLCAVIVADRIVLPEQEQRLQRAFGGWYSDYALAVRRWL